MKHVDIRIGQLCREGRRVFYAFDARGEYVERFDLDDIEQALRVRDAAALANKVK